MDGERTERTERTVPTKDFALDLMVRALAEGEADVFATALVEAVDAGASSDEVDAALAGAFAEAAEAARRAFDPNELSEVFTALPSVPLPR